MRKQVQKDLGCWPSFLSVAVTKYPDKRQHRRKKRHLSQLTIPGHNRLCAEVATSSGLSHLTPNQQRPMCAFSPACLRSHHFSAFIQLPCLGNGATNSGQGLLTSTKLRQSLVGAPTGQPNVGKSLRDSLSVSSLILGYIKMAMKVMW